MVVAPILCAMHLVSGTIVESLAEPDDALLLQTRAVGKTGPICDEELRGHKDDGYRGCQTRTRSGRKCQKWTEQSPHRHKNTLERRPGKGLGDHNYCRNPDGEPTIWCYTTNSGKRWEFCDPLPCPAGAIPDKRNMPPNKIGTCTEAAPFQHTTSCGYYKDKCDGLAETLYDCFEDWLQCEHMPEVCSDEETTLDECSAGVHGSFMLFHPGWTNACWHATRVKDDLVQQGCQKYADAIQGPVFDALQQCQRWCPDEQRRCLEGPVSIVKALCYEHMDCYVGNYVEQKLAYAVKDCGNRGFKTSAETLFCGMCDYDDCPDRSWVAKEDWASYDSIIDQDWSTWSFGDDSQSQPDYLVDMLQSRSDAGELNADEHFAKFEEVLTTKQCKRTCDKKSVKSAR